MEEHDSLLCPASNILSCQFHLWYPNFKSVTFRSEIIDITPQFIEYLHSDGVYLPDTNKAFPKYTQVSVYDIDPEEDTKWKSEEEDEVTLVSNPTQSFPELEKKITEAICHLDGAVFPKLNWSSAKDAVWMSTDGTLKCCNAEQVFLFLKSSDNIAHDLAIVPSKTDFYLVLRKWHNLMPSMEFRCFVKDNKLIGISQREHCDFYAFLVEIKEILKLSIVNFYNSTVRDNFPETDFIFDIYITQSYNVYIVDFNPFGEITEPLLFSWEELHNWNNDTVDMRIVQSKAHIQPKLYKIGVPFDLVDVSSGSAVNQFIQKAISGEIYNEESNK